MQKGSDTHRDRWPPRAASHFSTGRSVTVITGHRVVAPATSLRGEESVRRDPLRTVVTFTSGPRKTPRVPREAEHWSVSGFLLLERRCDGVEEGAVALQRDPLRVELQAAKAAELLAAAGVPRSAMEQLRQDGAGSQRLARDLLTADVDAAVVRRDGEHAFAEEVTVVAVDGADEPAATAPDEIGRGARRRQRGYRSEDLVLVHDLRRRGVARQQQHRRDEVSLSLGRERFDGAIASEDRVGLGGELRDPAADVAQLVGGAQWTHRHFRAGRITDAHLSQLLDHRLARGGELVSGDEDPPDRSALLSCLLRHVPDDVLDEDIPGRAPRLGIRPENRRVEGIGFDVEPGAAPRELLAQLCRRLRGAGEGDD